MAGRFKRLIGSLREHGIAHVIEVIRQERIRRRFASSLGPIDNPVPSGVPQISVDDSSSIIARATSLFLPWSIQTDSSARTLTALRSHPDFPDLRNRADRFRNGSFTALGLSIVEPDGTFDWHRDYGSGHRWENLRYDRIEFMGIDGTDVKYVWELSRMIWIGWLGMTRAASESDSEKEKIDEVFQRQVDNWLTSNPFGYGVNWSMPMDVAIRGFWLAAGSAFFSEHLIDHPESAQRYLQSLLLHGVYLQNNLEYFPILTNHYISNCFGLLVIGSLFVDRPEGREWFTNGKRRLQNELRRQTTIDGVNYERSIGYHGLVLEMFLLAFLIADRADDPFTASDRAILQKMIGFTDSYLPPAPATVPQFGDSDDGRILSFGSAEAIYDHRWLGDMGKRVTGMARSTAEEDRSLQELMLYGASELVASRQASVSAPSRSALYPVGGFGLLKSHSLRVMADVGPIGLHGNNDTLSFTLHSGDGIEWIVDAGTGCYTRDEELRNELRRTSSHNTPVVENEELAPFAGLWRVAYDRTNVRIGDENLSRTMGPDEEQVLSAEHYAWAEGSSPGVVVAREWRLLDQELRIIDRFRASRSNRESRINVTTRFLIHPEREVEVVSDRRVILHVRSGESPLKLEFESDLPVSIESADYSPSYGIVVPARRIVIASSISLPSEIHYLCRLVNSQQG